MTFPKALVAIPCLVFTLLLFACQSPPAEASMDTAVAKTYDPAEDLAALTALSKSYETASRAGDHVAISALHADDATVLPNDKPVVSGRAALDASFAANDSEPDEVSYVVQKLVISDAGDMAYEIGSVAQAKGAAKYLTVWRKVDGRWLIVADASNDDAPSVE